MWAKVRRLSGRWVVNLLVGVCLITIVAYSFVDAVIEYSLQCLIVIGFFVGPVDG